MYNTEAGELCLYDYSQSPQAGDPVCQRSLLDLHFVKSLEQERPRFQKIIHYASESSVAIAQPDNRVVVWNYRTNRIRFILSCQSNNLPITIIPKDSRGSAVVHSSYELAQFSIYQ